MTLCRAGAHLKFKLVSAINSSIASMEQIMQIKLSLYLARSSLINLESYCYRCVTKRFHFEYNKLAVSLTFFQREGERGGGAGG